MDEGDGDMSHGTPTPVARADPSLLSTRVLLFGEDDKGAAELRKAVRRRDLIGPAGLGRLSGRAAAQTVGEQVSSIGQELVDLDAGDVLVRIWRKRKDLVRAAQQTLEEPGSAATVVLAAHDVHVDHQPRVEVLVEGVHIATVTFDLALDLKVEAVVAVLRDGALVEIAQGDVHVTGTLSVYGEKVLARTRVVPLPDWFALRGRLTLVQEDEATVRRRTVGTRGYHVPAPHPH
jgi:hypothetical protein